MTAVDILKHYNLNKTHCRVLVLEHLMRSFRALSQQEIEHSLRPLCNRSTIYRILNKLTEKRIVQNVTINNVNKYLFDEEALNKQDHQELVYFQCMLCNQVMRAGKINTEDFPLTDGFVKHRYNFVIQGICDKCNPKHLER